MDRRSSATEALPESTDGPPRFMQPVRVASWLVLAFLCLLAFGSLTTQVDATLTPTVRVLGTLMSVVVALGFLVVQRHVLRRGWSRRTTLTAVVVVVLGLVNEELSDTWPLVGVAVAAAALAVPVRWSLLTGLAVWLTSIGEVELSDATLAGRIGIPLTTLLTAVVLFTLTRLAVALTEAHYSREHLARTHVDTERHRISRDLHDILGRTLVAASLRNQAALALLDVNPAKAREQLEQVHETITRGQASLRRLTSGAVIVDLPDELSTGGALCARLGISYEVTADEVAPGPLSFLAAQVVRESITNMLRHASPSVCEITIRDRDGLLTVEVVNDGAARTTALPTGQPASPGTGLADLCRRAVAAGGSLEAGPVEGERFRVLARLPHDSGELGGSREPAHPDR
ncbi:histidine kinase [Micromonospora rifamycinica]|uniref:sensor histidine kinase n=1 Tax=Micromonospora rifamycinica TaxID=291594 RepID=UPI0034214234